MRPGKPHNLAHIEEHYRTVWGNKFERVLPTGGPYQEIHPEFCVLVFSDPGAHRMFGYATCGMSVGREAGENHGLETFVYSPIMDSQVVTVLTAVAHYHTRGVSLGLGQTVNLGLPWLYGGSHCMYGYLSLPYLDGPLLEWGGEGTTRTRYLWLIPITKSERDYKKIHGAEALEERFEQGPFNHLDPWRPSVV